MEGEERLRIAENDVIKQRIDAGLVTQIFEESRIEMNTLPANRTDRRDPWQK